MLKIKKIEIEGFRGFTQKTPIEFENPIILLYGGNHQGKSSVLNAIEWCLYGDDCIGEKSGIRERVGTGETAWRVVNDNSDKAQVKMEIEGDQGNFSITRAEAKGKGKKGKSIRISLPEGIEKEADEAEQELAKLLRLSFKDFESTVYQHQETIHDFIIQKPSEQSDALDRLLGLVDYRNILDGIKKSDISKVQKEIVEEFNKFQIRVQEAIKQRQKDLDDKKDKIKEKGLNGEELNEKKLFEIAELTIKEVDGFARLLGLEPKAVSSLSDWKNTHSFMANINSECYRLWAESPEIKEQTEKQEKRSRLVSLKSNYETQFQNAKAKLKELQDFEKENGKRDELEDKIKKTIEDIENIDKEIKRITPKAKLIKEGISILKEALPPEANICPLCGEKKPNLLVHLQKEWEEKIEAKVKELNNQRANLEQTKTGFERLIKGHIRLDEDAQKEKERLDGSVDSISKFLQRGLTERDDPPAILYKEIEKINSRLKEIEDAIKSKREKIDSIYRKTETMNLLYEILLLKNKIEEIEQIKNTDAYQKQEKIRDQISKLVGYVEQITEKIKSCMKMEAEEKIGSAKDAIDRFFRKITSNPAFQRLNIRVEVDPKTGGNYYVFEDQDGKRPIPILSQGDLNSLALSIFLGLAKTTEGSHSLGIILIDDPSQSLDSQQKARLIEPLNELANVKDIIISTMDDELHELLKGRITKVKTIYKFSDWKPESGPKILKGI
jgi:DNA repair exonuclease SbcCD ATPase subunit